QASYSTLVTVSNGMNNLPLDAPIGIGAFDGLAGCVYGMNHLAELWDDDSLRTVVKHGMEKIIARISDVEESDVIGGFSGIIGVLMSIYETHGNSRALKAAK